MSNGLEMTKREEQNCQNIAHNSQNTQKLPEKEKIDEIGEN